MQLENQEVRSKNKQLTEDIALKNKKISATNKQCTTTFSRLFELEQELAYHQLEISMHSTTVTPPPYRTQGTLDMELAS